MSVIKKICYTEKFTQLNAECNQYVFDVAREADKNVIKEEVSRLFGVKPIAVNIIRRFGKFKMNRLRRGHYGFTGDRKIAIVTLKKGDKIDIID